jgi:N-acylneuraminate cytidylyltransferase
MANLCIIPARGGSLRIPRKNIREFLGKPIIAYSIETAIKSGIFDEIMVSTDNQEIAEIAKSYSAKVPFLRSEKNSSNDATTFDVIKEVVTHYNIKNQLFQHICCLYPCAPFVKSEDLISGLEKLVSGDYDSVFPIVSYDFPMEMCILMIIPTVYVGVKTWRSIFMMQDNIIGCKLILCLREPL